jgi:acyl-coenzyme A thioesterase PaaI-like protein
MTLSKTPRVRQPNSKHCFVCGVENECGIGLRFDSIGHGEVEAEYRVPDRFQGYPGLAHGGIVACMLDEVLGRTVMVDDPTCFMYTAKMELRYRKPVPLGETLKLFGKLERQRGRVATAHAELRLPDGSIAVEAEGVLVEVPDISVNEEELKAFGWKVYPEGAERVEVEG